MRSSNAVTDIVCNREACGHVEKYSFFFDCDISHMLKTVDLLYVFEYVLSYCTSVSLLATLYFQ